MSLLEVRVPNIGDFKDVGVIEILVKPGDVVAVDASLVTLESDKATMDVPAPFPGTVRDVKVKVGDRIGEGALVLILEAATADGRVEAPATAAPSHVAARPSGRSNFSPARSPADAPRRPGRTFRILRTRPRFAVGSQDGA